jgi:hypothetical protein
MTLVIILCWYYASSPFNQKVRLPKPTDGVLNAAERSSHLAIQVDVGHPFTYGGIHGCEELGSGQARRAWATSRPGSGAGELREEFRRLQGNTFYDTIDKAGRKMLP